MRNNTPRSREKGSYDARFTAFYEAIKAILVLSGKGIHEQRHSDELFQANTVSDIIWSLVPFLMPPVNVAVIRVLPSPSRSLKLHRPPEIIQLHRQ